MDSDFYSEVLGKVEQMRILPGDSSGTVLTSSPVEVDQILQVKSSEVEIKYFSSISGWKFMEFILSQWPLNSWNRTELEQSVENGLFWCST